MKADLTRAANVVPFPAMPRISPFVATNRLRELREARGMKLREVAEAIGTTPTHVNRLERGERDLTLGWMIPLARVLGVTPADILLPEHGGLTHDQRRLADTAREVPATRAAPLYAVAESLQPYRHGPEVHDLTERLAPPKKSA